MKKLFLTSGLAMLMAVPAFATDPATYDITTDQGSTSGTYALDVPDGTAAQNATCQYPTLGTYSGDQTLHAKWEKSFIEVNLNANTSVQNGAATGSTFSTGTNVTTQLYAIANAMYKTYDTTTGALADLLTADTTDVIATDPIPVGHTVTLTFDPNYDVLSTLGGQTYTTGVSGLPGDANTPGTSVATRAFDGFFGNTGGTGDAYINDQGIITTEGISAATAAVSAGNPITWYASYKCATPAHAGTPTMRGYNFTGWYLAEDASGTALGDNDWCLTAATNTVHAGWAAKTGKITYSCGVLPGGTAGLSGTLSGPGVNNAALTTQAVAFDQSASLYLLGSGEGQVNCVAQGYHFVGWKCDHNIATGATYSGSTANYPFANNAITNGSTSHYNVADATGENPVDTACVAMWAADTVSITWDAGTGATGGVSNTCEYDSATITIPQPSRTGYTFKGWTLDSTAEGVTPEAPDTQTLP